MRSLLVGVRSGRDEVDFDAHSALATLQKTARKIIQEVENLEDADTLLVKSK